MSVGEKASPISNDYEYPPLPDLSLKEKLFLEKEVSGLYFSGHLLDGYSMALADLNADSAIDILTSFDADSDTQAYSDKQNVTVAGIITSRTVKNTKNGERMAFVTVEDRYAEIEMIVFPRQFSRYEDILILDNVISVSGSISVREDEPPKILLNSCSELVENSKYTHKEKQVDTSSEVSTHSSKERRIYLRVLSMNSPEVKKATSFIEIFPGNVPVHFYDSETKKYIKLNNIGLDLNPFTEKELSELVGKGNLVIK